MDNPKVSVIVPVYNTGLWLPRCLDSLLLQTLRQIEIICIDDASTDASRDILRAASQRDRRIRLLRNTVNQGVGAARNRALREARGEYVGFIDSDDFVLLDFYEHLYAAASSTGSDIAKGEILEWNNVNEKAGPHAFYAINDLIAINKAWFCYGFTSALFKRSLLEQHHIDFPEKLVTMEDPCFTIEAALKANRVALAPDAVYLYARNMESAAKKNGIRALTWATCAACSHIADMVRSEKLDERQALPVLAFVGHQLQGMAMHPDAGDAEVMDLMTCLTTIYENAPFRENFFYGLMRYTHEKNLAISTQRNGINRYLTEVEKKLKDQHILTQRDLYRKALIRQLRKNICTDTKVKFEKHHEKNS